jgi:hypothetical protein
MDAALDRKRALPGRGPKGEIAMKRNWIVFAFLVAGTMPLAAQDVAERPPEIQFDSVLNFLNLPPNLYFGEVAGFAVNSKGHVFVFSRGNTTGPAYAAAAAQLIEFDTRGKYVREIGHNLYAWSFAHAVRIDAEDNIWAADEDTGPSSIIRTHRCHLSPASSAKSPT